MPTVARQVAAELPREAAKRVFVQADVSDVAQAQAAVAAAVEPARPDRLPGQRRRASPPGERMLDTTPELFDQHIAVNLRGPFFLMQAAIADMVRRGEPGGIVNVLSIDSHGGQAFLAPYVAAKAGLAGVTKNAAHAHRWDRIRINGLNMGWSATDGEDVTQQQTHGAGDDWQREGRRPTLPMGKLGQVDEIADFVVFLLSDRSGVVTGSLIDWDQNVIGGLG